MGGMIKGLIFDLGNVLINFDHRIAAKRICAFTDKPIPEIYNLFFDSQFTKLFEEGKISPQGFFLKIKKALNLKIDYENFLPIWNEIFFFTEENQLVYRLTKSLKKNYRTALLSNINVLHFEYLKKNFAVFDAFHHIITSFALGCIKPEPLIYEKTLELLGALPYQVFYVDDRTELVQEAVKLGVRSFVYKGPWQLKKDLLSCGIRAN